MGKDRVAGKLLPKKFIKYGKANTDKGFSPVNQYFYTGIKSARLFVL
jgi:hypothetical protein